MDTSILVMVLSLTMLVFADKEQPIKVSDTGEGTECDANKDVMFTCLACSGLQQDIAVPITVCCVEPKAYSVCQICTKDPDGCLKDARSISSEEYIESDSTGEDDDEPVDKRYGRMFMGGWSYPGGLNKRFGRMFFGRYPGSSYLFGNQKDKRFGRLFANGYGYPSRSFISNVGKRYGRLFTNYRPGNKRYGSLFLGKNKFW